MKLPTTAGVADTRRDQAGKSGNDRSRSNAAGRIAAANPRAIPRAATFVLILALGMLATGTLTMLWYTAEKMVALNTQQTGRTWEIKFQSTQFHLWIEEMVGGDRTVDKTLTWAHLETAQRLAQSMLDSSQDGNETITTHEYSKIDIAITDLLVSLDRLDDAAERRIAASTTSGVGSASDQEFDEVFDNALRQVDGIRILSQNHLMDQMGRYRIFVVGLAIFCFVVFLTIGIVLQRFDRARSNALSGTEEANRKLLREVDERKLVQAALLAAKEDAEFANRTKSEFLANMSHELRTPLNAVIGFSEMIKLETFGPVGSPKYLEYVAHINDSGTYLLGLINDILDIAKIEAGKLELYKETIDVSEVFRSCITIIKERAREAGLVLEVEIERDAPPLFADERKLKQILINLLSNAVKFTPAGGRITLSVFSDVDGNVTFSVADTGIGIAPDKIVLALEPFGQVEGIHVRKHEGTGLGLPLTKSLVELHGGWFDLKSEVGVGTTVTATFPGDAIVPKAAAEG